MNTNYVFPSSQVGELRQALLYASGPASYSQATGDPVYNPGSGEYVNFPSDCTSLSGNYFVRFVPLAVGSNQVRAGGGVGGPSVSGWLARWFYTGLGNATGVNGVAITTPGTGGTNGTVTIAATGGGGTGATISVTTAAGIITSAKVLTPGTGYTSIPTFTIAAGTGVVTATIGATGGIEVGTGVSLAAESIQFGAVVSSL